MENLENFSENNVKYSKMLQDLLNHFKKQNENFLGYQTNMNFDFDKDLLKFLNYNINNVGDPFTPGDFTINSKKIEKIVLEYYAKLWNAKTPYNQNDTESYWGYLLSMGCSEGNLYAFYTARDYLLGNFVF